MDWQSFVDEIKLKGFTGPFEIGSEQPSLKPLATEVIVQGFQATIMFLAPMIEQLSDQGDQ